jgi:anti-sigma-K factor RskA
MAKRDEEYWRVKAGEYVLGTLSEREARRFERLRVRDAYYCDMADDWERRLSPLGGTLADTDPPPEVWTRIERQIAEKPAPARHWDRLGFWRGFGLTAAALAACLLAFVIVERVVVPPAAVTEKIAVLSDKSSAAWLVTIRQDGRRMTILPLREISIPTGKSFELWLVRGKGEAPVSLGLVPASGRHSVALPETAVRNWPRATQLAITLEPAQGWQPGTPYGQALFAGKITANPDR